MIEHFKKYWIRYTIAAAAIITGIVVAWNWTKWFGSDEPSEYDKCLEADKAKADGVACTSCISDDPAARQQQQFQGIIKDGVCVTPPPPPPNPNPASRYAVTNQNGADVYVMYRGNIRSQQNPVKVAYNTSVTISGLSDNKEYANTDQGWLSVNDIGII